MKKKSKKEKAKEYDERILSEEAGRHYKKETDEDKTAHEEWLKKIGAKKD